MSSLSCGTLFATIVVYAYLMHVRIVLEHFQSVGGLAGGLYPISFRTRQSSLLAAMVLIVTDWESS